MCAPHTPPPLQVPVSLLRSHMALIPQSPMVLTGSVRANLDPAGVLDSRGVCDADVWRALDDVGLGPLMRGAGGLDAPLPIATLSLGQRQLLCLARCAWAPAQSRHRKCTPWHKLASSNMPSPNAVIMPTFTWIAIAALHRKCTHRPVLCCAPQGAAARLARGGGGRGHRKPGPSK